MSVSRVPVIDIGGFDDGGAARAEIARQVARAVEEIGFLTVVGHGVPRALMAETAAQYRAFFDLPVEVKAKCANAAQNINRGYIAYGTEFVAASHGESTPPDFRETFAIGRFDLGDDPYYAAPEAGYAYEPNLWPDGLGGFADTLKSYYRAMEALNRRTLRIFATALALEEDFFLDKFDRHASVLRGIDYPEQTAPPAPGQLRCGAHSDFGSHTFLLIDDAPGGLQTLDRAGRWIDVTPPPESFVVNIGDLTMHWTNDRWLSNLHRVVNPPPDAKAGTRRQSIAFFVQPNYDAPIECIETCLRPGEQPRHPPVKAWEHRHAKLSSTTKARNG